jgi:hypothetical protein
MHTWRFWRETIERAVKSAAQTPLTVWGVGSLGASAGVIDAFDLDWIGVASLAVGAAIMSILTSIASVNIGEGNSPSAIELPPPG